MGKTTLTYCVGIDKHFPIRDKTANSLGFTGHMLTMTMTNLPLRHESILDNKVMNEHGCVQIKNYSQTVNSNFMIFVQENFSLEHFNS